MNTNTVFIADDYVLAETMGIIAEKLRSRGVGVIRGPKTQKGIRLKYPDESLQELFGTADVAVFSSRSVCDDRVINAAARLRGIVNPTIGLDTVDVKLATERGILIGNGAIPENYIGMAEASVMLMLMLMYDPLRSMRMLKENLPGPSLQEYWQRLMHKKTVGILGLGRIGRETAERLSTWGMNIISYHPRVTQEKAPGYIKMVDLDTFYAESDIIGVFLTVNEETRNMINDGAFAKMKDGVRIVNTGRGQVLDEDALLRALKSGKVASAALDTFQTEPLPANSPLRDCDNLILTPHIVGHALECQLLFADAAVGNIMNILNGEPPDYFANPEALPRFKERFGK